MLLITTQIAVIATGLLAGVFLTFSDFIMRSLTSARPEAGAEAMQEINRKVYRSVFLALFFAMAGSSVLLIGGAFSTPAPASPWLIAGEGLYLIGVFGITVFGNVPMNNRLDVLPVGEAASYWRTFAPRWTQLNHIRTVSSTLATIAFLIATQHL